MRGTNVSRRWSALLLLIALKLLVFAADTVPVFEELLKDYARTQGECVKRNGDCQRQYVENADKIAHDVSKKLDDLSTRSFQCHADLLKKLSSKSIDYNEFVEKTDMCMDDFDERLRQAADKFMEDLTKEKEYTKQEIVKLETDLDEELLEMRGAMLGRLKNEEEAELERLEEEQKEAKKKNEKILKQLEKEFDDNICVNIDNVKRELTPKEAFYLSNPLRAFVSKDLTDAGLDMYSQELSLLKQTLQEATESRRGLRDYERRRMGSRYRLLTEWGICFGCYKCISGGASCDNSGCRVLEEGDSLVPSSRILQYPEILEFPTAEIMVQHIFETRLKEMKDVLTKETTVEAKPCGKYPLTDPVVSVNPEKVEDVEEFKEAHETIAITEKEETQKYEEDVEKDYLEYQEELTKEELNYIECMRKVDEKLLDGKIDKEEQKQLYVECFEKYETADNDLRGRLVNDISKRKDDLKVKLGDLDTRMKDMIERLDVRINEVESENRDAVEEERNAGMQTQEEIERERKKLEVKFNKEIECKIANMKREFLDAEIPKLEDSIQRGANHAFDMCGIDLYMTTARLIDQKLKRHLLKLAVPEQRRLKDKIEVVFYTDCECVRCTKCDADDDDTCNCCLKKRSLAVGSHRLDSVTECFNTYMEPRVKKYIESQFIDAIDVVDNGVVVECSIS